MMSDVEFRSRFLGQTPSVQQSIVERALGPYMPELQKKLIEIIEPVAANAAKAAKPALVEALKDYAPMAIGMAALLFGAGIFTAFAVCKEIR